MTSIYTCNQQTSDMMIATTHQQGKNFVPCPLCQQRTTLKQGRDATLVFSASSFLDALVTGKLRAILEKCLS